eukprot:COSAG02_NODE_756_length_17532_cov_5.673550_18_plen_171_part_00
MLTLLHQRVSIIIIAPNKLQTCLPLRACGLLYQWNTRGIGLLKQPSFEFKRDARCNDSGAPSPRATTKQIGAVWLTVTVVIASGVDSIILRMKQRHTASCGRSSWHHTDIQWIFYVTSLSIFRCSCVHRCSSYTNLAQSVCEPPRNGPGSGAHTRAAAVAICGLDCALGC